jgi:hypothetical protein
MPMIVRSFVVVLKRDSNSNNFKSTNDKNIVHKYMLTFSLSLSL